MLVAVFLLRSFGETQYPGIQQAQIEFMEAPLPPQEGVLTLERGTTAPTYTDTVAQQLDLHRHQELQNIIHWGTQQKRQRFPFDMATAIENLVEHSDISNAQALQTALALLQAHVIAEQHHHYTLPDEWKAAREQERVTNYTMQHNGDELSVLRIESNMAQLIQYLFSLDSVKTDIIVQQKNEGVVRIMANPESTVHLHSVYNILRVEEKRKHAEHTAAWHHNTKQQLLYHSGNTSLTGEEIIQALHLGLDTEMLEKDCPDTGCRGSQCYFFDYDLARCQSRKEESGVATVDLD